MSNIGSDQIILGGAPAFVHPWIRIILGNTDRKRVRNKDWKSLEDLTSEQFKLYKQYSNSPSNVIFIMKKGDSVNPYGYAYKAVNDIVKSHCIGCELSLPGFYAFLRAMTTLGQKSLYQKAFKEDSQLAIAVESLITGYWELVKPSVNGDVLENGAALNGIMGLVSDPDSRSMPEYAFKADLPFKKKLQNRFQQDITHAQTSQPTQTPTLK